MNCIAAVSENWGIGRENDLLFHISEDMKLFRRLTTGHTLILGRRNLESFPGCRPLPKRRHLVLTTREGWHPEGVEVCHSLAEVLETVRNLPEEDVWVIGGGIVYREFLPFCREAYITRVEACPAADTFFPDLSREPGWTLTEEGERQTDGKLFYRFCTYENAEPLRF
ncbi:MAG: dihydrofolate reductase [Lachnospiraceae bacterium]|nr:dihydrofolate reductase [Lachnospiraceae bacterium]